RRGIPVWSELELGSRLLANPILGVTGTNGKTTTSELLGAMLGAPVAGNVGRALCDLDGRVEPEQLVVCEVSSFQLEDVLELGPRFRARRARGTPRPRRRRRGLPEQTTTRSPRRWRRFRASRTGSSSSPKRAASGTSTTRRRRTPRPRGGPSPPTTRRCTSSS